MRNVIVVYKKSTWELKRNSSDERVREYIVSHPEAVARWMESDARQKSCLVRVISSLKSMDNVEFKTVYRANLQEIDFNNYDCVVSVGGDGTFLETSHYLAGGIPLLGVNSDPYTSCGHFCSTNELSFFNKFSKSLLKEINYGRISLTIDGWEVPELSLNEVLICDENPAAVSQYRIGDDDFKSSGHLLATYCGQTAFIHHAGGSKMEYERDGEIYEDRFIQGIPLVVKDAKPTYYEGKVGVLSKMRKGKIYIDGEHISYDFHMGSRLTCEINNNHKLSVLE